MTIEAVRRNPFTVQGPRPGMAVSFAPISGSELTASASSSRSPSTSAFYPGRRIRHRTFVRATRSLFVTCRRGHAVAESRRTRIARRYRAEIFRGAMAFSSCLTGPSWAHEDCQIALVRPSWVRGFESPRLHSRTRRQTNRLHVGTRVGYSEDSRERTDRWLAFVPRMTRGETGHP